MIFFFSAVWILPVLYYGFTNSKPPWLPEFIAQRANVSRLFPREDNLVTVFEIHYRRHFQQSLNVFPETDYFQMRPFGCRTRLQRMIQLASAPRREALAQWVRDRLNLADSSDPVAEIRFVRFAVPTPHRSEITGRYVQASSSSVIPENIRTISVHAYP